MAPKGIFYDKTGIERFAKENNVTFTDNTKQEG